MKKKKRSRRGGVPRVVLVILVLLVLGAAVRVARMVFGGGGQPAQAEHTAVQVQTTSAPRPLPTLAPSTPTPVPTVSLRPIDPEEDLFQQVYDLVDRQQQTVSFTAEDMSSEQVSRVLDQILLQPEFFWLDGYSYHSTGDDYQVEFDWKYDDLTTRRAQVEQVARQALASIPQGAGDYETALALHDWLCQHIVYQYSTDDSDQDLYGALVMGRCVCMGYSMAYEYLLDLAGIQAGTVHGDADNGTVVESHAWTKLVLDGEVYYTDVTWDDQESYPTGRTYGWFAVTSARMEPTHFADPEVGEDMTPSTAVACNYHYRNGWVLNGFDRSRLVSILSTQPGDSLTVLAADESTYRQLLALLEDGNATVDLLEQAGHSANRYSYYHTDGALCIDLFLE